MVGLLDIAITIATSTFPVVHGVPRIASVGVARIGLGLIGLDGHFSTPETKRADDDGMTGLVDCGVPRVVEVALWFSGAHQRSAFTPSGTATRST